MKTKIATTFGLALMLGLGIFGTMLALGLFSSAPRAHANVAVGTVTVSPTKAREVAQYTIQVTARDDVAVGERVFVKFPSGTTVPSVISTANISIKSSLVTGASGSPNQLQNPSSVVVAGREIQITVPDLDQPSTSNGDNGIGVGASITITFLQAAGVQNPNTAKATYQLEAWSETEPTKVRSVAYAIHSDITISSTSKPRGDVITVTGVGLNGGCATCNIRFVRDPEDKTIHGTGSIDSSGVFAGTFSVDSGTASATAVEALAVEVTDATGSTFTSDDSCDTCDPNKVAQTFQNKAGATPRATSAVVTGTVTVDLVDFTATSTATIADGSTSIGRLPAANKPVGDFFIDSDAGSGTTPSAAPYKFVVPDGTVLGTHVITITDGTKTATFNLDVLTNQKTLTVTPATASIGQSITITGTGFSKSGTIAIGDVTGSGGGVLNTAAITVDTAGNWSLSTRLDTVEASASRTSDSYTVAARDSGGIVGKSTSAGFSRTPRALTLDPASAAPGDAVTVSGTGMTVDTNEVTTTAEVTISSSRVALTGTFKFPVATDGTFSGTINIPTSEVAGTVTLTATDNAEALNANATANRTATATLTVPSGAVTVSPASATTGQTVTVTGTGFPPNRTASALTIDGADAIPTGGITTAADGTFSAEIEVPARTVGGSLLPGVKIVSVTVGAINGTTTGFTVPQPTITLEPSSAAVEGTVVITASGFDALTSVSTLTIGHADVNPSPAPRASRTGDITATVTIPALNIGTYTVVMQTGTSFSGTATFTAIAAAVTPGVTSVGPSSGSTAGGTAVTIAGTDFADGATVTFGGTAATDVTFASSISLTATTPAGDAGAVDVVVTNPSAKSGTLAGGYTYEEPAVVEEEVTEGTPEDVFVAVISIDSDVRVVAFNAATGAFQFFDASLPADHPANDLTEVKATDGVWIFNNNDGDITVTILGRSHTLVPGWNLAGL